MYFKYYIRRCVSGRRNPSKYGSSSSLFSRNLNHGVCVSHGHAPQQRQWPRVIAQQQRQWGVMDTDRYSHDLHIGVHRWHVFPQCSIPKATLESKIARFTCCFFAGWVPSSDLGHRMVVSYHRSGFTRRLFPWCLVHDDWAPTSFHSIRPAMLPSAFNI